MKKKNLKVLRLAKKSISNLATRQVGGRIIAERSEHGGATCLTCPSFATICPECPSGQIMCQNTDR